MSFLELLKNISLYKIKKKMLYWENYKDQYCDGYYYVLTQL